MDTLRAEMKKKMMTNTTKDTGGCQKKCVEGNRCVCNRRPHVYHCCADEHCDCRRLLRLGKIG